MLFITLDGQHKHYSNGVISRDPLKQAKLDALLQSPYVADWLDRSGASILTPEFLAKINDLRSCTI